MQGSIFILCNKHRIKFREKSFPLIILQNASEFSKEIYIPVQSSGWETSLV